MAWTTTTLLAHVRRLASLPTSSSAAGYADADLLAHADAVLQGRLAPMVARSRDEHAVHFVDLSLAAGQSYVRLPARVAGGRLRDVTRLASDGINYVSVPRIEPEGAADAQFPSTAGPDSLSFVMSAGWLQLVPAPSSATTLRVSYLRTPPTLAAVSSCYLATGITPGTPNVVIAHAGTASGSIDLVLLSNGDSLGDSLSATFGVGSTTIAATAFSARFVNNATECARYVTEGLYICPAGTSCVVPLPDVVSSLLASRTAIAIMHAIGDAEAAVRVEKAADAMEMELSALVSERVEGEPQVIIPTLHRRGRALSRW